MEMGKVFHIDFDSLPYPLFESEREALSCYKEQAILKEGEILRRRQKQNEELLVYVSNRLKKWDDRKLQSNRPKNVTTSFFNSGPLFHCPINTQSQKHSSNHSQGHHRFEPTSKLFSGIPVRSPPTQVRSTICHREVHSYGSTEKRLKNLQDHSMPSGNRTYGLLCNIPTNSFSQQKRDVCLTHQTRRTIDPIYHVTAIAKGFLTRRLLNSEKVKAIITTIKDAEKVLLCLDNPVTMQDFDLQQRVINQLQTAKMKLHSIFFEVSPKERMFYIAHSRDLQRERQLKQTKLQGARISSATVKSIERKKMLSSLPVSRASVMVAKRDSPKTTTSMHGGVSKQPPSTKLHRDVKKQTSSSVATKGGINLKKNTGSVRDSASEKSNSSTKTVSRTVVKSTEKKVQVSRAHSLRKPGTAPSTGLKLQRQSSMKHRQT